MSGRSLLSASLLLLAMGTAAPGAAQVIEDPHWRRITGDYDVRPELHRPAQPSAETAARIDR
ncbi:MAG TPA: hypothetical protein VLC47_03505 [Burkholderiales bacterium]|nr:hypothetical protein [Burkholderiales bacterium]